MPDESQLDANGSNGKAKSRLVSTPFLHIAERWGIFAAMAVFFIWQADRRESALNARIERQQEFIEQKLLQIIEQGRTTKQAVQEVKSEITDSQTPEPAEND